MSTDIKLAATARHDVGKGASRRLRRQEDKVPAIVYGGDKEPLKIAFEHKDILKAAKNEAFFSQIITVSLDGKEQKLLLKDIQRHPYKPVILHLDFQRITGKETLHVNIPLHFINEDTAPAVKEGGIVSHIMKEVEVITTPANLPEFIEVDLANLAMDQTIHLSEVKLPKGVEAALLSHGDESQDPAVVNAHKPKVAVEETEAEVTADAASTEEAKPEADSEENQDEASKEG